jgi:adenylate cyclase
VIARNSTFAYKGKAVKINQIAEELGVRYVLEGSIQRSNDSLRITVQLIDAIAGHHIWAENYDRKLKDIFSLQDEIAMQIMAELQVNIAYQSLGRSSSIQTKNLKAYEKFLKGAERLFRRTEEDTLHARKIFKEAIALDPEYGAPYVMLGYTYLDDIWYWRTKDRAKTLQKAEQLAQKAVELTGQDDFNLRLLSSIFMLRRQYDKAIIEIQKAIELSPNSAQAYFIYGMVLRFSGRNYEAIPIFKKAIRLNPVTPIEYLNMLAWAYFHTEQYEEAIPLWNKTIELNPDYLFAYQGLTGAYQMSGDEIKARESAAEILRIKPTYSMEMVKKFTIKDIERKKRVLEAYRKAGIPE